MTLLALAKATLAACHGERLCREAVPQLDLRATKLVVAGAGKAAMQMANGVVAGLRGVGRHIDSGLLVIKEGTASGFAPDGCDVLLAGHPVPDERSVAASQRLDAWLSRRTVDELCVFVLSGGASSLLARAQVGLSLVALQATTEALLRSGLGIAAINQVRRQLTCSSGGRLAARTPARVAVLVLSDVVAGDIASVGSGPFAPDAHGPAEALDLVKDVPGVPDAVLSWLQHPPASARMPAVDDACFARVSHHVIATPATLRDTAAALAGSAGFDDVARLPAATGDVQDTLDRLVLEAAQLAAGVVVVGGGEPTVTLPQRHGRGGRNQHLALLVAQAIAGRPLAFVAIGSDGNDGSTEAAGARVDGTSWKRLTQLGDPLAAARSFDAFELMDRAGLVVRTGATGTNLCDLHLLAVDPALSH